MMRILVDAQPMTGLLTGIARYLRNMYAEMDKLLTVKLSYFTGNRLYHSMPPLADTEKWQKATNAIWKLPDPIVFGLRSAHWLNYERQLKNISKKNTYDLYHETAFIPAKQKNIPSVYSIYDLSLRRFRETHPRERVWFFEYFLKRRLKFAGHILTISDFIKDEIIDEFKVPPEMVTSIPLAPDPIFGPRRKDEVNAVKNRLGLPGAYLLFVSSLEPRKNIGILIKAMQALRSDIPVVLVGWHGWGEKEWMNQSEVKGLNNRIYLTGHVSDNDLVAIYNGATALVYPSIYEGFGLPIVEAMACGCPVICSSAASMPEAAGKAALQINPYNRDDLAEAIETLIFNSDARNDLIRKGHEQAGKFSWQRTAEETYELFKKVSTIK